MAVWVPALRMVWGAVATVGYFRGTGGKHVLPQGPLVARC